MPEYIEREAAIAAVLGENPDFHYPPWYESAFYANKIKDVPAANVAPVVHGEWISWEAADNYIPSADRHECSVCHDAAQVLVNGVELLSFYCPNCGARMGGGVDNG